MTVSAWTEFGVLFAAALVGAAAVLPYAFKLLQKTLDEKPRKTSLPTLALVSFLQAAVLAGLAIGLGLPAAHAIGLGAPYLEAALIGARMRGLGRMVAIAAGAGACAGAVLLVADLLFLPYWPTALVDSARRTTVRDNFLASLYGGIDEEIFIRLFGFSGLAWLLTLVWHTAAGLPTTAGLWTVNVVMTLIFGLGHLPALKNVIGNLPRLMVARTMLLNAPIGLLCGWLFWTSGIEAAMLAHFAADIVYHVIGTLVINRVPP